VRVLIGGLRASLIELITLLFVVLSALSGVALLYLSSAVLDWEDNFVEFIPLFGLTSVAVVLWWVAVTLVRIGVMLRVGCLWKLWRGLR
jgi:hypothetical protein